MIPKSKSLVIRCTVFLILALLLFVLVQPFFYIQRLRTSDSVTLEEVGVSITHTPNGDTTVKVDDREQTVPKHQLEASPLYKEAMLRMSSRISSRIGQPYPVFRLRRFIQGWVLPMAVLYVVMFHVWQPRKPYIEGGTA